MRTQRLLCPKFLLYLLLLLLLQVMLGVDRLDMIKGIPQKLLAFEKFLHEHPEWRDKVLLVQVRSSTGPLDGFAISIILKSVLVQGRLCLLLFSSTC
jgi:hypothetical protein